MHPGERTNLKVLRPQGDFDAAALCHIRDELRAATAAAPVVVDFRDVEICQPFALAALFETVNGAGGAVRTRGLCRHHELLLGYLGLRLAEPA